MRITFFINGWRESKSYFYGSGKFTRDEIDKLNNGEIVKKNGNEYRITCEEV